MHVLALALAGRYALFRRGMPPGFRRNAQKGFRTLVTTDPQIPTKHGAEALLDAAEQLFLERGYANVSMQQIAEAAGFTKGATYYHFQSKEDLYLAVSKRLITNLRDQLLAPFDEPGTFEEQLRKSIRAVRRAFGGNMQRWWSDAAVVISDQAKATFIVDTLGVADPSQILTPVFRRAQEQGVIRNVSPEAAARIYTGLVTAGLDHEKRRWLPNDHAEQEDERAIDEIVTVFLHGVQGVPPDASNRQ